jgi:uncharacterized membrane protein YhaH (DUF805 family)
LNYQMFLFSTSGRITRTQFWLAVLIYLLVSAAAATAALIIVTEPPSDLGALVLYIGGGLVFFMTVFSAMAVTIKRLHDRNKIGWWNIPFVMLPCLLLGASNGLVSETTSQALWLIAAALGVWGVVELGLLRGTAGPNRFGCDPLNPAAAALTPSVAAPIATAPAAKPMTASATPMAKTKPAMRPTTGAAAH